MEAAVKECIRDVLDYVRRLREMPAKRYIVRLTEDEGTELLGLITKGITSARRKVQTGRTCGSSTHRSG